MQHRVEDEHGMVVIPFGQLKPNWKLHRADQPGYQRWAVTWVGGSEGFLHMNREVGGVSDKCLAGLMVFPVGTQGAGLHTHGFDEVYIIHRGRMAIRRDDGSEFEMGPLDAAYMPAGAPHTIRNIGDEDAYLIFFHTALEKESFQQGGGDWGSSAWLEDK